MVDEIRLLRQADPAARDEGRPLDERARRELDALLAGRGRVQRAFGEARRHRPWLLATVAAGLALVAVALPLVGVPGRGGPRPAFAATPPLLHVTPTSGDASTVLRQLAVRAGRQAPPAEGELRHTRYESWDLTTRVDHRTISSAVVPQEDELRWAPDLSGTFRAVAGATVFPNAACRRAWEEAGSPAAPGTVLRDETYAPGRFRPMFATPPPGTPVQMRRYLAVGHPIEEYGSGELFTAISDLALEWRASPAAWSALLRVVAGARDVHLLGDVTDRAGRPGVAVATDSTFTGLPTRWVMVLDRSTGRLLAIEQWLTTSAGMLDVPVPSVIGYTLWR